MGIGRNLEIGERRSEGPKRWAKNAVKASATLVG
jgi:hypothetical protein